MKIELIFWTAVIIPSVSAYSSGPPTYAVDTLCSSMDPSSGHGGSGQTSAAPYSMEVSPTCYTIGQQNTVTLKATQAWTTIGGFFTQLRSSVANSASYGTFNTSSNSDVTLVSCFGETANAIGHCKLINKVSTTFKWMPPTAATDNYSFVTTVVKDRNTFWVKKVTLTIAQCSTASTVTPTPVTVDPKNTRTTSGPAALAPVSIVITQQPTITKSDAVTAVVTTWITVIMAAVIIAS